MMYEPREDSILLERCVKKHAEGKVLDVGTGSGIQAIAAAREKRVKKVLAVDIDEEAVNHCKKLKNKKIKCKVSDLFENVKGTFDTIIFNPPYLPQDKNVEDRTIYGGKKGYEIIETFLNQASKHLKKEGIILIVFSSLTNKNKFDEVIKQNLLQFKELGTERIFFETLYCYLIRKTDMLKKLESKGLKELHYLAKGKRGIVYAGVLNNIKVAVKVKRKESKALAAITNEAKMLELLNKKGMGPKLLFKGNNYFCYEFVEGEYLKDWILKADKKNTLIVLKKILNKCFELDKIGVSKEEMHRSLKHAIIKNSKVKLIDFERAHKTKKPHNVTQFLQFIMSRKKMLEKKGIKVNKKEIIALARKYKNGMNREIFNKIKKELK